MDAIFALITKDITIASTKLTGARIHMRRIIWYEFCTFVTSVVRRVTSPAVLNLSILEKAKVCILSNMPFLKFLAKPVEAFAP